LYVNLGIAQKCPPRPAENRSNLEDLRQYVLGASSRRDIRDRLDAEGLSPDDLANLLQARSGGKFLFAQHALRELADGTLSIQTLDAVPPEGMGAYYRLTFRRRFGVGAERYAHARAVLGVLCAAHEPLLTEETAQILGVSQAQVLATQRQIPDFIKLHVEGPHAQISFDHLALKEWLTQGGVPAGDFAVDLGDARERIHSWACGQVQAGQAHRSTYLLRHLAGHLKDEAQRQAVYALLLLQSFEWSQAQLDLTGVRGLLADVEHLGRHPDAAWLRALIRRAEPVLWDSTAQWPAQVLSRLGPGSANIALESLATAAQRWAFAHPDATLLPLRRSLLWRAGLHRQLEGEGPILVLPDGRIAYARGTEVCVADPDGTDEPQVHKGHTGKIKALAVLPDGRVVSGSYDCSVRVWSLDGAAPRVLEGHTREVVSLAVLSDGRVASGSWDGTARVWSLTGAPVQVLQGHTDCINPMIVLSGGRLVTGSDDKTIRIWSLDGAPPQVLEGHTAWISRLAVLLDGRLVSASADNSVRLWSLDADTPLVLEGHSRQITALAVLPDGRVVSGSIDGTVRVWSLTGDAPQVLDSSTEGIKALALLPDGRLAGIDSSTVRVWSLSGSAPQVLEGRAEHVIEALAVLADGRLVSAGSDDDRCLIVWNLEEPALPEPEGHAAGVCELAVLPDGRVVSASDDGSVRQWSFQGGVPRVAGNPIEIDVEALAVLPDGRLVCGGSDSRVRVLDLTTGRRRTLKGHDGDVYAVAVLPDGRVASASWDRTVRVWSRIKGAKPQVLEGHTGWVNTLAVLPDGRLVSGSHDHTLRVWSLDGTEAAAQVLEGHTGAIYGLAVLPDGRVVSCSADGSGRIWDLAGGTALALEGHTASICALTLLPAGGVVTGGWDRSIRVWSLDGASSQMLEGHTGVITGLAVLPDGRLVSGSDDKTVRVWSGTHGTYQLQRTFVADAAVSCLTLTQEGVIVAGCIDGTLHFLQARS
jgi:WD40 repeat protein